jgi:putative hydrolase of the HAD superfamily
MNCVSFARSATAVVCAAKEVDVKWLLCDYGEVLTLAPSQADREALETEARSGGEDFWVPYWRHRPGYDSGRLDSAGYWTHVLGKELTGTQVRRLQQMDTVMWSRPSQPSLEAASQAASHGTRLAILSNAPAELADAFDRLPWLAPFAPRLFSGRLGIVKPDPAIFLAALDALQARPGDVSFIDDRPENVVAARHAGLRATLFIDPGQIRELATG